MNCSRKTLKPKKMQISLNAQSTGISTHNFRWTPRKGKFLRTLASRWERTS